VEAGKMDLHVSGFTLERLSQKLLGSYQKVCAEKGLQFSIDIHPDTPRIIHTDFQRLEQILINFISNALKFTEVGSITLAISRPAKDTFLQQSGLTPGNAIAFAVSDTGIGIKKKMQQLIFEAFQQADGSTSRKFGGTGLGLSISREFAKHLRGEIQLDSEQGEGSRFTLYLPEQLIVRGKGHEKETRGGAEGGESEANTLSQANAETEHRAQMDAIRDDRRDLSRDDKSILIIEDDPVFLKTLKSLAQEKGFKTLIAGDGETGLHMADYYHPSAIILDVGLPGMDGWKVMTRLKETPGTRHIPVHFISGTEKPHDAIKMGAVGYLLKPVSMDQLNQAFATIEELIDTQVKRLMLVGGDETEIVRIKELLNDEDISIENLGAGNEALQHLRREVYHCIILGLTLSDMAGTELIRQIREDTMISHVPIIVYTDKELTNHERVYLDSHCERVITKNPKSLERLFDETTLFLHRVEANLPENKRRILKMVHDKESIFKDKKILITDDDMRNVFALTSILEDKGIKVVTAKNGREGVSRVVENPDLDLVLMDIMMPEMNGYDAMRKIREMDGYGRMPIIALTAKAMRGDRSKCIEAGANDYLSKPVDSDKLLSMLRVWLYR
jgi:tubulin-specific chaperone A